MPLDEEIVIKEIDKGEAARYLGYRDTLPDLNMTKLILQAEIDLFKVIKPRYCFKVFDLCRENDSLFLGGTRLELKGDSIRKHLSDCEKAAALCVTLSDGVDKLLRQNEVDNMVNALIIDALANAAVEQVCDEAEKILFREMEGYSHTWRFGVGYGDFPLSTQKELLEIMNAGKRIGLCATESCILVPRKSVTCLIGLRQGTLEERKKTCENCHLLGDCEYRRKGTTCY